MADLDTLKTLSYREMASGWAEGIKHGLILDAPLFQLFEEEADALMELAPDISALVIRRSMAIKARVVEEDERETLGKRMLLNYGHTTGHALEAVTHYTELLHGEAVAIGMRAAAEISQRMGLLSPEAAERQNRLLMRFGLPTSSPGTDPEGVLRAIELGQEGLVQDHQLDTYGGDRPGQHPLRRAPGVGAADGRGHLQVNAYGKRHHKPA